MRRLQPKKEKIKHFPTAAVRGYFPLFFESNKFERTLICTSRFHCHCHSSVLTVDYFLLRLYFATPVVCFGTLVNNPAVENTCQSVVINSVNSRHLFHGPPERRQLSDHLLGISLVFSGLGPQSLPGESRSSCKRLVPAS